MEKGGQIFHERIFVCWLPLSMRNSPVYPICKKSGWHGILIILISKSIINGNNSKRDPWRILRNSRHTVIGGTWKGIDYMRSKSNRRNFTPSLAQLEQQAKFALMMRFLQPMSALLKISFHDFAIKKTGINSAFSYNLLNAITGVYPAFTICLPAGVYKQGRPA